MPRVKNRFAVFLAQRMASELYSAIARNPNPEKGALARQIEPLIQDAVEDYLAQTRTQRLADRQAAAAQREQQLSTQREASAHALNDAVAVARADEQASAAIRQAAAVATEEAKTAAIVASVRVQEKQVAAAAVAAARAEERGAAAVTQTDAVAAARASERAQCVIEIQKAPVTGVVQGLLSLLSSIRAQIKAYVASGPHL